MTGRGIIIAAPTSRSGKTTISLGLARAFRRAGLQIRTAKSGPDYIDSAFLAAASGRACVNLDAFAMGQARLDALAAADGSFGENDRDLLLIEGAMGLFDGAPPDGRGAVADLAAHFALPVVLVVDCGSMAQSVAPLVAGFLSHRADVQIAGLILNRVGSDRHETMLQAALSSLDVPVLGAVRRSRDLARPSRHLGLVQAGEVADLDGFLDQAATQLEAQLDISAIAALARPVNRGAAAPDPLPPLGQRIALASDVAFAFAYPHILADWRQGGAEIVPFSPLADEAPDPRADAIFLPGGYPELHALTLTRAGRFRGAMQKAAQAGTRIYGECGGYMVLGQTITDARGVSFPMCGLLDLETSFERRRLSLGYRHLTTIENRPAGANGWPDVLTGHEFHYATTIVAEGAPLFAATDALGTVLPPMGLVSGSVSGSFAHIIDQPGQ